MGLTFPSFLGKSWIETPVMIRPVDPSAVSPILLMPLLASPCWHLAPAVKRRLYRKYFVAVSCFVLFYFLLCLKHPAEKEKFDIHSIKTLFESGLRLLGGLGCPLTICPNYQSPSNLSLIGYTTNKSKPLNDLFFFFLQKVVKFEIHLSSKT